MHPKAKSVLLRLWRQWIYPIALVLAILLPIRSSVADWHDVPTQSMEPTILVGDRIFVNKLAYDLKVPFTRWHIAEWSDPRPGDVVTLRAPDTGKRLVKRVIAVPGDRVAMQRGRVEVNGALLLLTPRTAAALGADDLTDPPPHWFATERLGPVVHAMMLQPNRRAVRGFEEIIVPPGHYFVMGDNRDNSRDSRFFGLVPRNRIEGRAIGVAFSLDHDAWYCPRWGRFFRDID